MDNLKQLKIELKNLANKKQAAIMAGFFKTGQGEYGEGDIFLGLASEETKRAAKKFADLGFNNLRKLLNSKIHEERAAALRILLRQYGEAKDEKIKKQIVDFYLGNAKRVNSWDLVDLSGPDILGDYLLNKPRKILYKLARSKNLWEKRIAVISTLTFIRAGQFSDTLKICGILLNDKHDLIHKATGWMLREAGKRDKAVLLNFLSKYYKIMPRAMLRYAVEKLNYKKRKFYLGK